MSGNWNRIVKAEMDSMDFRAVITTEFGLSYEYRKIRPATQDEESYIQEAKDEFETNGTNEFNQVYKFD